MNLVDYKNTVLERFSNEAMHDQLTRIASDSASKVPVYSPPRSRRCSRTASTTASPPYPCRLEPRAAGPGRQRQAFEATEPRLDDEARRQLASGDPAEALRIEPLLASGIAEHADFVAGFEGYRKALAEHGAKATLQAILDATAS